MTKTLPPGPPLPAVVQAGLFWLAPIRFLDGCHRRYGDRFTVRVPRINDMVYLTDRDDIRSVLRGDPAIFHAGEANALISDILGSRSVLVVDDEEHRRIRGMILPAFHGDSVRRQVAEMVDITTGEVARWPVGELFPVLPRMRTITLEIILRTVFGVHEQGRLAALRTVLPPMAEIGSLVELLPPPKVLRRVGPWRRRALLKARARALLADEITRCRQDPQLVRRTDALAMLVRDIDEGSSMPDDELIDQLLTLLFAGNETTSTALAWTFERLTRDPALLDRTAAAAAADGDDAWLDAVCKESLRARPVVIQLGRKVTQPVQLAGYTIPAGTILSPYLSHLHRSAQSYPDPEEFRPQRFLDQRADTSAWFPFGAGARRCLGATFAQAEMRTVLRTVLRSVELTPATAPDEPARTRHGILVPRHGALVSVRRHLTATKDAT